jgi:hypothetical protein
MSDEEPYLQHYRVKTSFTGPWVVRAQDFQDLLDKLKLMMGQAQPMSVEIEHLQEMKDKWVQ